MTQPHIIIYILLIIFFNYVYYIITIRNMNDENTYNISIDNVPEELDDHFRNFGKYSSEVDYTKVGYCNFCNSRIDEFGFCACIGGQPD